MTPPPTLPTDPTDIRKSVATLVDAVADNTRAVHHIAAIITTMVAVVGALALSMVIHYIKR